MIRDVHISWPNSRRQRPANVDALGVINAAAAIWVIISPVVLVYSSWNALWNSIVSGVLLGVLGFARIAGNTTRWLSVGNAAVGVWLVIAAFWLAEATQARWNSAVIGIAVCTLGAMNAKTGSAKDT